MILDGSVMVASLFGMLEEHQIYPAMLVILTNVLEP